MRRLFHALCLLTLAASPAVGSGAHAADTLRLMTYNVRNAIGLDGRTDVGRVGRVITGSRADIVAVQELDSATARDGGRYVLGELAVATGLAATYAPAIDHDGGRYGIGLLSRAKPLRVRRYALPGREERRALLLAEFDDYAVACMHLSLTEADRLASLPIVREAVAAAGGKPVFLAGDWNDTPGSVLLDSLGAMADVLTDGAPSYPADAPTECLDYVAATPPWAEQWHVMSTRTLPDSTASDHRPKLVTLVRRPAAGE